MSRIPPAPEDITAPMIAGAFSVLTPRESQVLRWLFNGKTDGEIGGILGISPATASTHVRNLLPKLGVENRNAATLEVVRVIICRRPPSRR